MDAGEVAVGQDRVGQGRAVGGDQVDDAGRQARGLEDEHRVVRRQLLGAGRLPDDGVAHQRWGGRQVAADRREVERGDRVDEALQRAVVAAVPDPLGVQRRLLGEDLLGEVDVDPPEVDELTRRVDLGLGSGLALPEHRRGVEGGPPRAGQQLGGLEQDRGPVGERQVAPHRRGGLGRVDGALRLGRGDELHRPEDLAVGVRLDDLGRASAAHDLAATDRARQLDLLAADPDELGFQARAFGAAWRISEDRLVRRSGHTEQGIHRRVPPR